MSPTLLGATSDPAPLPTRQIGRTDLSVSVLGFGAGPLGGMYRELTDAESDETVEAALASGMRYVDVAPFYGHGKAEHRLGRVLRRSLGPRPVLSTKVGRLLRPTRGPLAPSMYVDPFPFEIVFDYGYDGVIRSVEDSLQRLGLANLDIVYLHDVNRRWHGDDVERRFDEAMEGGYRALDALRASGAVKAIGVGVNDPDILVRFAEAGRFDVFMLAGRYTLLDQSPLDHLFPVCEARGVSVVSAAPFNSGILATGAGQGAKYFYADAPPEIVERTTRLEAACARYDVPLAAAALQFALHHPVVASVVAGCASAAEARANARLVRQSIPDAFWSELEDEGLIRPDAPIRPCGFSPDP